MSCNCGNITIGTSFVCLCDQFIHPKPLNIGAGLSSLPRQIATFPEFRRAMLLVAQSESVEIIENVKVNPLANWRARDKDDLGIMLLEMWAYVCDSLSFYDEVLANEAYLHTSQQRTDLRRLVALLGYLPRPAVGSVVKLAALADGRLNLKLPSGTAFSSGAFDGNPPQTFELDNDTIINPLTNQWNIIPPHEGKILTDSPGEIIVSPVSEIKEGALLLITNRDDTTQNSSVSVQSVVKYSGIDGKQYTRIIFTGSTKLLANAALTSLRVLKPSQFAGLWAGTNVGPTDLVLNSLNPQVKPGDAIIVVYGDERRCFTVSTIAIANQQNTPSNMVINGNTFSMPGITVPVTQLTLDADINSADRKSSSAAANWDDSFGSGITVFFGLQTIATVIDEPKKLVSPGDQLSLDGAVEAPLSGTSPSEFLLQDKNTLGTDVGGSVNYAAKQLVLNSNTSWNPGLISPVKVYGNVITASRGQTVLNEILGSGNASVTNQTFKLQKKPLTYHISPTADNDNSVSNSLTVYVNDIKWAEVKNFYNAKENDQVYIVRQNDDGDSLVTFGDGVRGERVPSGANNIIANYRFGAEKPCPPVGAVNQISKPVKSLQSVKNVLAAFGGDDAQSGNDMRIFAPRSALVLGRVVSLKDMEALASSFPGVRAVKTEWCWNKGTQQAAAHIYYIGDSGLTASLGQRIRNYSDPTIIIVVENAQPVSLPVSMVIQIDPRCMESDVVQQIKQSLMDTQSGLLAPENIGIGLPLYRSKIFEVVLSIDGAVSVEGINLNGNSFDDFAVSPDTGKYYDVETGGLTINGI